MKLYTLEYSFNKPMQQTITVGTNTDYMIGVSAVKNGELINLQPQDVTLTIGENVLTSEKLINGYVVFDYSQGRKPVSEIVKVTILDKQFDLLIVGKFSSKGDVGGSGGVAEETDPIFVEKCLSADSIALGNGASSPYVGSIAIGTNTLAAGSSSIAIGKDTNAAGSSSIAIGSTTYSIGGSSVAIGTTSKTDTQALAIGVNAKGGNESISLGYSSSTDYQSYCIAIGNNASVNGEGGVAIGYNASSQFQSIAIGNAASIGGSSSIQLGTGTNSNDYTLQVWDHTLLNKETGLIPPERLGTGYDSSQRQVLVNNYGTLTWETYNG